MLQEQPPQEYINTSLTSSPPMVNSAKADLIEPMIGGSPRYSDSNTYYPNSWGTNMGYSNNYYYNSNNNQQYLNTPTPAAMVLYPQLYHQVNQNQIHLHLHGTAADKLDYINHDSISLTSTRSIEIGLIPPPTPVEVHSTQGQIEDSDRTHAQADPSSVWRPY